MELNQWLQVLWLTIGFRRSKDASWVKFFQAVFFLTQLKGKTAKDGQNWHFETPRVLTANKLITLTKTNVN